MSSNSPFRSSTLLSWDSSGPSKVRVRIHIIALFLLLMSMQAYTQTACPQGAAPGSPQCGPTGGGMLGSGAPRVTEQLRWVSTWGAYAEDTTKGIVGSVTQQRSERAAHKAAVKRCKEMGGEACEVVIAYSNGCAVIAEPIGVLPVKTAIYEGGGTVEEMTDKALPECSSANGGRSCKVIHSTCTRPYLARD